MHTTKIVNIIKLADGLFSVAIQCCDEHMHMHTMAAEVAADPTRLNTSLNAARELAASNHDAAQKAAQLLEGHVGAEVQHGN